MIDCPNILFLVILIRQLIIYYGIARKVKTVLQELTERFQEMRISLNLNEVTFILGSFPQNTSNIHQFLARLNKVHGELLYYPRCQC